MTNEEYEMKIAIIKSTLGEANSGRCGSRNNCYYKGTSRVWIIMIDDVDHLQVKTKKLATAIVDWINASGWTEERDGELEMCFYASNPGFINQL